MRPRISRFVRRGQQATIWALVLLPSYGLAQQPSGTTEKSAAKIPAEQLDSLVAPIALYPDELLAQTLVAATYPLELVQLQQWLAKHKDLKDKALSDAVAKQPWDPSVQSMAATPEVVKRLTEDIQWTTDLGNAFLAQQADVMDAVQRMRKKAKDNGALESNKEQKVETKTVENKTVIVVEPASPEVVYVPSYSPTAVYGPPVYPYPPIYYPPYAAGAAFVSFGVGVAVGAAFWGGSCCGCGWGNNNIYVNRNNNFNRVSNYRGTGTWQHNPQHRGGAPYGDRATANRFGAEARASRTGAAGGAGLGGGAARTGERPGAAGGAGLGGGAARTGERAAGAAGGDRVGNRSIEGGARGGAGAFGGGRGSFSGSGARASSFRGASSFGGRRGGGRR